MDKELRVLILEDDSTDAELMQRELRNAEIIFSPMLVASREEFIKGLEEFSPDLILADYKLPSFDGISALDLSQEKCPNVPFIFVTGTMGEEWAVETLKRGAVDYVLKNRIYRLASVVKRALKDAKERTERKRAEETAKKLLRAIEQSPATVLITDPNGSIEYVNPKFTDLTGYTFEEAIGKNPRMFQSGRTPIEVYKQMWETITFGVEWHGEFVNKKKNGEEFCEAATISAVKDDSDAITHYIAVKEDITERKRSEEKLQQSELRYRGLVESAPDIIYSLTKDGTIVSLNPAFEKITGWSRDEWIGKPFMPLIHPEDLPLAIEKFQQALQGKAISPYELRCLSKSGSYLIGEFTPYPNFEKGKVGGIARDITERKLADEALKTSEEKYRLLSETAEDIIAVYNNSGEISYTNTVGQKCFGLTENNFQGRNVFEFVSEKYHELLKNNFKERLSGYFGSRLLEVELINGQGTSMPVEIRSTPIVVSGNITGFISICRDISVRKLAEKAMSEHAEQYRTMLSTTLFGFWLVDVNGKILDVNDAYCRMSGYTRSRLLDLSVSDLEVIEKREDTERHIQKVIETGTDQFESKHKAKDGRVFDVEISTGFLYSSKQFIVFIRDITERKRAEKEIVMLASALKSVNECVSITDLEDKILFVNQSFLNTYGFAEKELVGQNISIVRSPNNAPSIVGEILPSTLRGGWQGELLNRKKDGAEFPIFLSTTTIPSGKNEPVALIGVAIDITERKRAEEELIRAKELAEQSDKLKTEFLAQMSHEIRTPINIMAGNVDYLKDLYSGRMDTDTKDCFDGIDMASKRIIRTVDLILNAAELKTSGYKSYKVKVDLNSEILNKLYQEHLLLAKQKGLELIYKCESKDTKILADSYSLTQIFANLMDNAIKYTKKGKVEILLGKNRIGNIMVEIKDTGIGISKEFLPRMFEPFLQEDQGFTRSYDGSGLGLALTKNYCEINNAVIEVESEKNVGSTFRVMFQNK